MLEVEAIYWMTLATVTLFAALAQSAAGFGFAIVAVPLYLLVLNSHSAVQLAIVLTPMISLALLWRLRGHLHMALLMRLVVGTVLGLPIGMAAFMYASLIQLKIAVALLIVCFAGLLLVGFLRRPGRDGAPAGPPSLARDLAAGLTAGAMTTSLGMPGPPVVLYLSTMGLDKNATRATVLTLALFSYTGGISMQMAVAGISLETWRLAAAMIPFVIVGSVGGHYLSAYMSQRMFRLVTLLLLLATGIYMLFATLPAV